MGTSRVTTMQRHSDAGPLLSWKRERGQDASLPERPSPCGEKHKGTSHRARPQTLPHLYSHFSGGVTKALQRDPGSPSCFPRVATEPRRKRHYFSNKLPKASSSVLWVALNLWLCSLPLLLHTSIQVFPDIWRGSVSGEYIFVFLHMLLFVSSHTLPINLWVLPQASSATCV